MREESPAPTTLGLIELALLAMVSEVATPTVHRPEQGQDNSVAIVDERWVIRIAKTPDGHSCHANELALLKLLPESCNAPRPLAARDHAIIYEYIPGGPLDREAWLALDPAAQSSVAHQLHFVLQQLHALPSDSLPDALDVLDAAWVRSSIRTCSAIAPRHRLALDPARLLGRFEDA